MVRCRLCLNIPCLLEQGLYDSIVEKEQEIRDGDPDGALENNRVRYKLYRHATKWIHGYLGPGHRIPMPQCVRTEIIDLAPEPAGGTYVGFQQGT